MKKNKFGIFFCILSTLLVSLSLLQEFQLVPDYLARPMHKPLPPEKRQDRSFVFIVPMYNHSNICEKMLRSIADQTYQNYRVICIDDGSPNSPKEIVLGFLESSDSASKFHYVEYQNHRGSIERLYEATQQCKDDEIVIYFEGNSWLKNNTVLEKLNDFYKNEDVWIVHGQHEDSRTKTLGKSRPITSQNFFNPSMRRKHWAKIRFKTFYAKLFKKVKIQDFFFRGKFVDDRFDQAYMFPMMEMAGHRAAYFPEVCLTSVKDDGFTKIARPCNSSKRKCLTKIIGTPAYEPLNDLFFQAPHNNDTDLIIFSYDRPMQLHALLESTNRYMQGYHKIFAIYKASSYQYEQGFEKLKKAYPSVQFIQQTPEVNDFKPILMQVLEKASPYILLSVDDMIVKDNIDLKETVDLLESTEAYCFSLRLGAHINYCYMGDFPSEVPDHVHLNPQTLGWQINSARGDWTYPNSLDMTIYRRDQLIRDFAKIKFRNPNQLEIRWNSIVSRKKMRNIIGLCYKRSKALNIPLNQVFISENRHFDLYHKEELLQKYLEGTRIDISPLFQLENISAHIDYEPTFIEDKSKVKTVELEDTEKSSPSENSAYQLDTSAQQ